MIRWGVLHSTQPSIRTTNMRIVVALENDIRSAIHLIQLDGDQPITLTDATLAAMGRRLGLPVWTYDHHFDIMQVEVWRD